MTLRRTAFHDRTAALGATFVEYADYDFPSQFADDPLDEYRACRERAIVIDLTPLRKVEVSGPGSFALLQAAVTRDLRRLSDGDVVYTALCDEGGNVIDDGTVFRFGPDRFRWIGYTDDDEDWFRRIAEAPGLDVTLENSTDRLHNFAVQGPLSRDIMTPVFFAGERGRAIGDLTWFTFTEGRIGAPDGPEVLVSRTGYSGELGYEVWCHPDDGPAVWDAVWDAGEGKGLSPLGLDALDVVRVEAGLIFKGYEYEGGEDPFEAGIGFTVGRNKTDDYVGKAAVERRRDAPTKRLVGLELSGGEAPAHGDEVLHNGEAVGTVTSGIVSPFVGSPIALARVALPASEPGTALHVRPAEGEPVGATVVRFPFYDPDKTRPKS
jgi:aminomethyltransferase